MLQLAWLEIESNHEVRVLACRERAGLESSKWAPLPLKYASSLW